jgi:hypothetical protein
MAQIIEFYIPKRFQKKQTPQHEPKGKVVEFGAPRSKSA